jgi:hypothetical protein
MAQYVAGLAQQIALILLVLIPTLEARSMAGKSLRLSAMPYLVNRRSKANSNLPGAAMQPRRTVGK